MLPNGLPYDKIDQLVARAEIIDQKLAATEGEDRLREALVEFAESQGVPV